MNRSPLYTRSHRETGARFRKKRSHTLADTPSPPALPRPGEWPRGGASPLVNPATPQAVHLGENPGGEDASTRSGDDRVETSKESTFVRSWEIRVIDRGKEPLIRSSLLRNLHLRGGLTMFFLQYLVQAGSLLHGAVVPVGGPGALGIGYRRSPTPAVRHSDPRRGRDPETVSSSIASRRQCPVPHRGSRDQRDGSADTFPR
jgi:hypothetical protein